MLGYFVGACYEATEEYQNGDLCVYLQALENPIPECCAYFHASKSYLWLGSNSVFGGFGFSTFLKDSGFFWISASVPQSMVLRLPIVTDNPSRALLGNTSGIGSGRVNSWFDHHYPNYGKSDDSLTRWDGQEFITSRRGESWYGGHNGVDFSHNRNTENEQVYAAAPGTVFGCISDCKDVDDAKCNSGYGNQVWIDHGNGYATRYNHFKHGQVFVVDGQNISDPSATPIGTMGNTGHSEGIHLHFGVYYDQNQDGTWTTNEVVDPFGWYGTDTDPCSVNGTCVTGKWMWSCPFQSLTHVDPTTDGIISSPAGLTTAIIPAGAVSSPVNIELQDLPSASQPASGYFSASRSFLLNVLDWVEGNSISKASQDSSEIIAEATATNSFTTPVIISVEYAPEEIRHLNENLLTIFRWDETTSQYVQLTTQLDTTLKKASAQTTEMGRFDLQAPLLCSGDDSEPNDSYGAARAIASDGSLHVERFDIEQDEDWFYFNALTGQKHRMFLRDVASGMRVVFTLFDSDGTTVLAIKTATSSSPITLNWRAPHEGAYFLRISMETGSNFGCSSTYTTSVKQWDSALPAVLQMLLF